jgi:hypothetical protein
MEPRRASAAEPAACDGPCRSVRRTRSSAQPLASHTPDPRRPSGDAPERQSTKQRTGTRTQGIRRSRLATFLFGPVLKRARVQSRLHRDLTCCFQHSNLVLHSRNCTATSQLAQARSCLGAGHLLSTLPLSGRDCPPCSALSSVLEIAYRCRVRTSDRTRTEYLDNSDRPRFRQAGPRAPSESCARRSSNVGRQTGAFRSRWRARATDGWHANANGLSALPGSETGHGTCTPPASRSGPWTKLGPSNRSARARFLRSVLASMSLEARAPHWYFVSVGMPGLSPPPLG